MRASCWKPSRTRALAVVWGEANLHVLGDRGRIPLELDDVKRFDSGVVLLTYLPL